MTEPLYTPAPDARQTSQVGHYLDWLQQTHGRTLSTWDDLHHWSVTDLEGFWGSLWEYFDVQTSRPYERVLSNREMPGARWFEGALLNYAERILRQPADAGAPAVIAHSQSREPITLSFAELRDAVARARTGLRRLGVGRGDRVVAYLPNIPETLVAYLATASLGAIWASCAPEFGSSAITDRFAQIEPKVLLAIDGYTYGAKHVDRREELTRIRAGLPTVDHVVHVPYGGNDLPDTTSWADLTATAEPLAFEQVPFDHPLCVLFTSGTTGKPKAIIHGHGGILIEHFKNHSFSWDLRPGDRMLWFSTTAWMLWNALVSALLVQACVVMIDGDPAYPDLSQQWRLAAETRATLMGVSPGYLLACRKAGMTPATSHDLSALRQIGAAGSPLPAEGYHWVHEQFGPDVLLNVGSGGTDVCTGIVQGSPLQPVWPGEISGPCLAVAAKAFDEKGHTVVGELGELVITEPMPSMPVGFWGDTDGRRYRAAYFEDFPGIWRHGDWVRFAETGSCVITGRSDATLNRGGVRLGTAEFYSVVERLPEIVDSLVIHLEDPTDGMGRLLLFVQTEGGVPLDDVLTAKLRHSLRSELSPRHVPDEIVAVPLIPRNRTGKKLELPAKRILQGRKPESVASIDALADPSSLDAFVRYAEGAK